MEVATRQKIQENEAIAVERQELSNMVHAQLDESHIRMATELGSVNKDEEQNSIHSYIQENYSAEELDEDDYENDYEVIPSRSNEDHDCNGCNDDEPCDDCAKSAQTTTRSTIINTNGSDEKAQEKRKRKDLIKYGAIATAALVLVILAIKFLK